MDQLLSDRTHRGSLTEGCKLLSGIIATKDSEHMAQYMNGPTSGPIQESGSSVAHTMVMPCPGVLFCIGLNPLIQAINTTAYEMV